MKKIQLDKTELRKEIKAMHKLVSTAWREQASEVICKNITSEAYFCQSENILLYHALWDEVSTRPILEKWYREKKLYLPVVVDDDLKIALYDPDHMQVGAYGILEPTGDFLSEEEYARIELVIVPGVGFDCQHNRMGRGKGYYDRLLPMLRQTKKIGVCFNYQILEEIPAESWDIKMDEIVSEKQKI